MYTLDQLAAMEMSQFKVAVHGMSFEEMKSLQVRPPFPKDRAVFMANVLRQQSEQHGREADQYYREANQHKANAAHHQRCVAELTRQEIELNKQIAASREKERQAIKEFGETVQKQEKRNNQQKDEPCCSIF